MRGSTAPAIRMARSTLGDSSSRAAWNATPRRSPCKRTAVWRDTPATMRWGSLVRNATATGEHTWRITHPIQRTGAASTFSTRRASREIGRWTPRAPPFSYRPGEKLDDYLVPPSDRDVPTPDVHGNQVGLLRRSKCYRSSPGMSCSTCHDVHRPERDVTAFAQKCLACHQTGGHPMAAEIGGRMLTDCIDCHMPNRKSKAIQINAATRQFALYFRSHAIGIYREAAAAVLQRSDERRNR